VLNAAQLLEMQKGDLDPPLDRAAAVILRQTQHLAHLVDDLLDTARVNSGRIQLHREVSDLVEIAREGAETFRPGLTAAGHEFLVALPEEALPVHADRHRIVQVLDNLLDNAAKFTGPAAGTVSLELERAGHEAVLRVVDTGRGIDPDDLPHLFDLFEQRRMNLDRSMGGMGLGLYLVKQLVELHGGTVAARSAGEGRGAEFSVRLPLSAQHRPRDADEDTARQGPVRRVLVIEDNADAAESMEMLLTALGHEVRTAGDGPEGLAAAEAFQPDVALVDLGLPRMDGFEVARRLRSRFGAGLHIVAVTGYSEQVYRQTAAHAGFDAHLVKPSTVDDVKRVLSEHRHDDQGAQR
ncbi:MAG TPA: ATP-binding protein, partial [Burkholderiales bacterium]|nr:ATP-binding protein [Burkholderiales bacterium]